MTGDYTLSDDLNRLISHVEGVLGTGVILLRQDNIPEHGILIDDYTYGNGKNMILFSSSELGMLKDFVIAKNCFELLYKGIAAQKGQYQVLSFDQRSATHGMKQIYLDILKDENTRMLDISQKKKMLFSLYLLFRNALSELPWSILSNIYIAKQYPVMRNSQVYLLMKESMREMHALEKESSCLPQRYYVMHNGIYYARDTLLAYSLAEYRLNPVINIPELQQFRALDMKDLMDSRWSRSHWYHTKVVGDAMSNILKLTLTADFDKQGGPDLYYDTYQCGLNITNRWLVMMAMQDWYIWESPDHLRDSISRQVAIEESVLEELFSG
jgi:hypothetical protein